LPKTSGENSYAYFGSTLDLILTNFDSYYVDPKTLNPLGKADHLIIVWRAKHAMPKPKCQKITYRPLLDSSICSYGLWLTEEPFNGMYAESNIHKKVDIFSNLPYKE
jgi:hypothetical protein